jgi:hypothetical protein
MTEFITRSSWSPRSIAVGLCRLPAAMVGQPIRSRLSEAIDRDQRSSTNTKCRSTSRHSSGSSRPDREMSNQQKGADQKESGTALVQLERCGTEREKLQRTHSQRDPGRGRHGRFEERPSKVGPVQRPRTATAFGVKSVQTATDRVQVVDNARVRKSFPRAGRNFFASKTHIYATLFGNLMQNTT